MKQMMAYLKKSKGNILVFLDADVELTQDWQNNIESVINQIIEAPLLITGSRCLPPQTANIIKEKYLNSSACILGIRL